MGVVSWMVGTADAFLADAAESQFGAVASNIGAIVLLMVTLSAIGLFINMAFQYRSMDGASFFWYLMKLMLVGLFAFNWVQFNAVANADLLEPTIRQPHQSTAIRRFTIHPNKVHAPQVDRVVLCGCARHGCG